MDKKPSLDKAKRTTLRALATGSALGALAGASSQVHAGEATPTDPSVKSNGYRETEHVRRYYDSLK
ncbi:formate dehydrogenase [Paraferrimonas sedimenticola]|uniref:Formate dehydrogenase region TAT target n=1 Tax=Paraferrimonas sedimenticola TaxID=375674 RepID=A0AA37RZN1_9GAMM|nr:formate dehydrogenase [Paraferrimonas sedimenticola]GLP97552.1 hypothetical protein GCM10007895_28590 [Paraferrimonas sedimenticola]